jgi:hypothetical protein
VEVSIVEAIAAVSAHRTLRDEGGLWMLFDLVLSPVVVAPDEVKGGLFCAASSRANLAERDSLCCDDWRKCGLLLLLVLPSELDGGGAVPDDDDVWGLIMACEGRLRLAPVRGLAARFAADVIVSRCIDLLDEMFFLSRYSPSNSNVIYSGGGGGGHGLSLCFWFVVACRHMHCERLGHCNDLCDNPGGVCPSVRLLICP